MAKKSSSSWKPSTQKRTKKTQKPAPQITAQNHLLAQDVNPSIPVNLQQSLLNVFRDACNKHSPAEIEATLQQIKGHLYKRDFTTAFGKDEYLEAYAARWSPSRALGYVQIFTDISSHVAELATEKTSDVSESAQDETSEAEETDLVEKLENTSIAESAKKVPEHDKHPHSSKHVHFQESLGPDRAPAPSINQLNIVCLGGGAGAEVVGLAGWLKYLEDIAPYSDQEAPQLDIRKLDILGLDIANWGKVMQDLHHRTTTPPVLSKFASETARASNAALLPPETFSVRFEQQDVLEAEATQLKSQLATTDLVTVMFTLNELYTTSVPKTQRLLSNLSAALRPGTLLLVVDSPGSYSTVTLNGAEKKYPMQWLLDHTLLGSAAKKEDATQWEKLVSDESRWFRLPKSGLKYPIDLENMRYQIHLYRKLDETQQQQEQEDVQETSSPSIDTRNDKATGSAAAC